MQINIDIYDIASEEEIKAAALEAVKSLVVRQFSGAESNLDRLVSNLSYQYVYDMVDQQYDGKLDELLKLKMVDAINALSEFTVFRRKDAWEKEESVAYKILREESANARPLIKARVEQLINDYPFREIQDDISDTIHQCIIERMFGQNDKQ